MTNKLDTITATKINELHQGLTVLLHLGIEKAVEIGRLLTEKKAELQHGEFGTWIKDNLVFTDRSARNYMRLFENQDKVLQAGNISEAYKMLGEGKNENGNVSDLIITSDNLLNMIESKVIKKERLDKSGQFKKEIQYAKDHPELVPVGKVTHYNVNGFHCIETITGELNGFPFKTFEIIDPEYEKIEAGQEPFNHSFELSQIGFYGALLKLKNIIRKFPERIKWDSYSLGKYGLGEKQFIYDELMNEWQQLETAMNKLKQLLGEDKTKEYRIAEVKKRTGIEGGRPGWVTWGAEN